MRFTAQLITYYLILIILCIYVNKLGAGMVRMTQ